MLGSDEVTKVSVCPMPYEGLVRFMHYGSRDPIAVL